MRAGACELILTLVLRLSFLALGGIASAGLISSTAAGFALGQETAKNLGLRRNVFCRGAVLASCPVLGRRAWRGVVPKAVSSASMSVSTLPMDSWIFEDKEAIRNIHATSP